MAERDGIEAHLRGSRLPGIRPEAAVVPDYAGYSIRAIPQLVRALFGERAEGPLAATVLERVGGPASRVILVILDGLGYRQLLEVSTRHPDLGFLSLADRGVLLPVTSVFPSTTVAALATYATGRTPYEHGLVGYRLYLRETAGITNMIRLSLLGGTRPDSAFDWGLDRERLLEGPFLLEDLGRLGVETQTLLPQQISSSGLSAVLYRHGDRLRAVASLADMVVAARRATREATGRLFVQLYWPSPDTLGHVHGPRSDEVTAELRLIDACLERELDGAPAGTVLLVASDHGLMEMRQEDYLDVTRDAALWRDLVLPPVGEPRASYLFVKGGREHDVAERLAGCAEDLLCLGSAAALDTGLFGGGARHPAVLDRLGNLVVVSTGQTALYHPYRDAVRLRGMHGGLTDEEMLVPLLACRL